MKSPISRAKFTPPQVAKLWGISPDKVLAWLRSGQLRGINAAAKLGGRPRYLIDIDDLRDFELRRSIRPAIRARKRQKPTNETIEFF